MEFLVSICFQNKNLNHLYICTPTPTPPHTHTPPHILNPWWFVADHFQHFSNPFILHSWCILQKLQRFAQFSTHLVHFFANVLINFLLQLFFREMLVSIWFHSWTYDMHGWRKTQGLWYWFYKYSTKNNKGKCRSNKVINDTCPYVCICWVRPKKKYCLFA